MNLFICVKKSQVEDARTALDVYKKFQLPWERNVNKYLETFDEPCYEIYRPDDDYCVGYSGDDEVVCGGGSDYDWF
jgi:hypothetical protein